MRDLCAVAGYYVVLEECVFFFLEIRQGIPSKSLGFVGKDGLS